MNLTRPGGCTITAGQAGDSNYEPASSVPQTFNITEVNQAPAAVNDTLGNIAEDSAPRAISFADLTGNDSKGATYESGQTLTIITANNAVGGSVVLVPGFVVFTPIAD